MSYTYKNSATLKNLAGITDSDELEELSYRAAFDAIFEIRSSPLPDQFDIQYLKEIHRNLFAEVFEWAGHTRDEAFLLSDGTIATQPVLAKTSGEDFVYGKDFSAAFKKFDEGMIALNNLKGMDRPQFVEKAAEKFAEINAIHPFREGNGRTQRLFFERLGEAAGHQLESNVVTADRMISASIDAHESNDLRPMKHMFEDISNPEKSQALFNLRRKFPFLAEMNVSFAQDGQKHHGIMGQKTEDSFFIVDDNNSVVVGRIIDLTIEQQNIKEGQPIEFTSSIRHFDQTVQHADEAVKHTFFEGIKKWGHSVEDSVKQQIAQHPRYEEARTATIKQFASVWKNPEAAFEKLSSHGRVKPAILDNVKNNPERVGDLVVNKADALKQIVPALSVYSNAMDNRDILVDDLTRKEKIFREEFSKTIKISPELANHLAQHNVDKSAKQELSPDVKKELSQVADQVKKFSTILLDKLSNSDQQNSDEFLHLKKDMAKLIGTISSVMPSLEQDQAQAQSVGHDIDV